MLEKYKNKLIAHRGLYDNIIIPENSLRAFKSAITENYPIEIDIHLTKDNNLVVFHDHNLKRMTEKPLIIENLIIDELKEIKLLDTKEKIPTLEDILKLVDQKVLIIIEIKANNNEQLIVKTLLEKLKDYQGEIIIHSFNRKVIKILKNEKTAYKVGLLISENTDKKFKLFQTSVSDIKYSKPDFLSVSKKLLRKKHLKKYLNKLPILVWTIKNENEIKRIANDNYIYICDNLPYKND